MITATNEATGEVIELEANSLEQIINSWKIAQQYEKAAKKLKDQLKELIPNYVNDSGISEECDKAFFRVSHVQKMNYDKSVVREVFDEDTFDLFTKIDKTKLDNYIKDNLDQLGEKSTILRSSMIEDGKGYSVIKLEKIK